MRALLPIAVALASACGGHAPPPDGRRPRADRPTLSNPWVVTMAADPQGLQRVVDPARGLVVVQFLGCEREPAVEEAQHRCGAQLDAAVTSLQEPIARAARQAENLGSGIACGADGRCRIPPTSECDPEYSVVFVDDPERGPVLVGVVERDDWQHPDSPEVDAEMRRLAQRAEDALAAARGGCH